MFDIVLVRFLASNDEDLAAAKINDGVRSQPPAWASSGRSYEYRVPDFLKGKVAIGMLGVVSIKNAGSKINAGVVVIEDVKNVLDGDYSGDHAYLVGVVDPEPFADIERADRRRKRLLDLIKQEKERLVGEMDLSQLASLSPTMANLVAELQGVNGGNPVPRGIAPAPDWVAKPAATGDEAAPKFDGRPDHT
jgi:hypothetical protein